MAAKQSPAPKQKKYYTAAEANATLPLVRAILGDVMQLAADLRERTERLRRAGAGKQRRDDAQAEELQQVHAELERDQEKMAEFFAELGGLGIELKDPFTGLIDFPCWMNNHEVYLCWRHGEPEVAHWHEVNAGFSGRQKIQEPGTRNQASEIRSQESGIN